MRGSGAHCINRSFARFACHPCVAVRMSPYAGLPVPRWTNTKHARIVIRSVDQLAVERPRVACGGSGAAPEGVGRPGRAMSSPASRDEHAPHGAKVLQRSVVIPQVRARLVIRRPTTIPTRMRPTAAARSPSYATTIPTRTAAAAALVPRKGGAENEPDPRSMPSTAAGTGHLACICRIRRPRLRQLFGNRRDHQ